MSRFAPFVSYAYDWNPSGDHTDVDADYAGLEHHTIKIVVLLNIVHSLLAYLILHHNQPISCDKLTGILWPERSNSRARRSLSHALWQIRSVLHAVSSRLTTEEDTISFNLAAGDWLDVMAFQDKAKVEDDSREVDLSAAFDIYRADFMEACYDDWALLERERLRSSP
jgi:DNA-binding SARP family transcriptional activator